MSQPSGSHFYSFSCSLGRAIRRGKGIACPRETQCRLTLPSRVGWGCCLQGGKLPSPHEPWLNFPHFANIDEVILPDWSQRARSDVPSNYSLALDTCAVL